MSHISVVDAWLRAKDLSPYWEQLVAQLRALSPQLIPFSRFPDFVQYRWFEAASPEQRAALNADEVSMPE